MEESEALVFGPLSLSCQAQLVVCVTNTEIWIIIGKAFGIKLQKRSQQIICKQQDNIQNNYNLQNLFNIS